MLVALAFISFMYLYWSVVEDIAVFKKIVGFICCTMTILFFASPLTMLVSTLINKCINFI